MRVIRFTADWCGPCKQLKAMLNDIDVTIPIDVIDIDKESDTASEFGIRSIPTLVMLDGNIEVKRKVGLMDKKELTQWLLTT